MADDENNLLAAASVPLAQAPQGAKLTTAYVERNVRVYAITDSEVDSIGQLNTQASAFLGIGAFLLASFISVYVNASFYDPKNVPPAAELLCKFAAPACGCVAVVFFALGGWAIYRRSSTWERIRNESKS